MFLSMSLMPVNWLLAVQAHLFLVSVFQQLVVTHDNLIGAVDVVAIVVIVDAV